MEVKQETIEQDIYELTCELLTQAKLQPHDVLVVGCSTSEVIGKTIGKGSSPEVAQQSIKALQKLAKNKIDLAAQCCEHLNRALVVERKTQRAHAWCEVNAIPIPHAGGSWATQCYKAFADPVLVDHIKAQAGIDIGDTFIGMHLQDVAVPVRLSNDHLGEAHLTAARVRPPYTGGPRATYNEALL